jgi:hypothetical protein
MHHRQESVLTLYAKAATLPKRQASRSYRDDDNLSFIFDVIQHHVCADRQKEMVGLKLDRIHKARISSKFSNNARMTRWTSEVSELNPPNAACSNVMFTSCCPYPVSLPMTQLSFRLLPTRYHITVSIL